MENLVSRQFLSKFRIENINESTRVFNDAEEKRKRSKYSFETSVFLSHKHGDKEIIQLTITLFKNLGIDVYVDWQDGEMPKTTNGYTARRIKEKIRESDKFILLATETAINSKWCNWELGYGDAYKYHKNIAIMPITNNEDNNFSGTEYLQIYPAITSEYRYTTGGSFYVEFENNKMRLQDWLKQK